MADLKLKLLSQPALVAKVAPVFNRGVTSGDGIDVTYTAPNYVVSLDTPSLTLISSMPAAETDNHFVAVYNSDTDSYGKIALGTFAGGGGGGGLLDADYGDITVSGGGTVWTIDAQALTKTDDTNVTLTLGGSPTTALVRATSLTLGWTGTLAVSRGGTGAATLTDHGVLLGSDTAAITATAVMTDGQLLVGQTTADPLPKTISGDVTVAASGAVTIANDAVSNAKLANVNSSTFKARISALSGDPEDITGTQATTLLDIFVGDSGSGGLKGLVPDPAAGDAAAGRFLKADGNWDVPAGSGSGDFSGPGSATDNAVVLFDGVTGKLGKNSAVTVTSTAITATVAGANGFTLGRLGATTPALHVDNSAGTSITGLKITAGAAGGGVSVGAIGETNVALRIDGNGSGAIRLNTTGTGAIEFGRNAVPSSDDGAALGTTALKWSDLHLASGGVINWNNGDVTVTHSANALAFAGATGGYSFDDDLLLASGGVINFNSGDVTITHSANALAFAGGSSGYSFDAAVTGTNLPADGLASQADQETGTSTTTYVSPGRQQFHPSAVKLWGYATVSGGTPTLQSPSYNITSITDTAVGRLTVTIATDFSSANYAMVAQCMGGVYATSNTTAEHLAGSFEVQARTGNTAALTDPFAYEFAAFGDQ